ncbi:hypothetical protein BDY17DRAFT_319813 [Neohortaea acidophila]|uniref:Biogenesis of lysosome-related organelles complex 1 subunit KXD1 n=1 Tax=Neohortaea acidophila TaxID=245834 RepID=A0A6A6Q5D0_9PEZI|nr:uncharacterized protein BDY17DRAFT_319813 [Neohortaea acidophila]KAF2487259.1 hypothetical protein BDY17DRAFT_319813 [Neohortaea acidophila]
MPISTHYYQYHPTGSLPVSVPGKTATQQYTRHNRSSSNYSQYSASPPEAPESVATSGSRVYSSASSQYADADYESASSGATSVDLLEYMSERLADTYSPMSMDRNLAKQAQMSGELNAKNRELQALKAQARARLAKSRTNFSEGMKAAREVQRDLEWTQKKVHALNARAAQKYPDQYRVARERYPSDF